MHMTSQKGAPACWGSNEALPRAPSPCMQPKGQPLHAIPPGWPGPAHWLRGWAPTRSASTTRARSTTSLDPQHDVVVMETWRQCIRSIKLSSPTEPATEMGAKWARMGAKNASETLRDYNAFAFVVRISHQPCIDWTIGKWNLSVFLREEANWLNGKCSVKLSENRSKYGIELEWPSLLWWQCFHFSWNSGIFRNFPGYKKHISRIKNSVITSISYTIDIEDLNILLNSRNFQSLFQDIWFWKVETLCCDYLRLYYFRLYKNTSHNSLTTRLEHASSENSNKCRTLALHCARSKIQP